MEDKRGLLFLTDNTCIEVANYYTALSLIQGAVRDGREFIVVWDIDRNGATVETVVNVAHKYLLLDSPLRYERAIEIEEGWKPCAT